jgi:hypothetical protein
MFIFLWVTGNCENAKAETDITGAYSSASGKQIILELNISSHTPVNLIVEQFIDPKNFILTTSPRARKRSSGKIKWLFRNIADGSLSISIHLRSALQGNISAIVRYRNPENGQFIETQITP